MFMRSSLQLQCCRSFVRIGNRNILQKGANFPVQCSLLQQRRFSTSRKNKKNYLDDPLAVIVVLIGANVGVYFHWNHNFNDNERQFMVDHFAFSTEDVLNRPYRWHTFLSSIFSHDEAKSLMINMSTLLLFGPEAITVLGTKRFFQLYICGGVVSRFCHLLWSKYGSTWDIPQSLQINPSQQSLGAAGSINAVILCTLLSSSSFRVAPPPYQIALAGAGLIYTLKDLACIYKENEPFVNIAHLGGALCGALYHLISRHRFVL